MIRPTCAFLAALLLIGSTSRADALADAKEALRLLDQLDLKGAEKHLSIAIEAQPKMAALFVARAHLREHGGDLVGAGRDAMRASELGEDLWQWAAKMLFESKIYDAAAVAFEGAWKVHGQVTDLEAAAKSRATAGQYKDGIRLYELLAKRVAEDERPLYVMATGNLRSLDGEHEAGLKQLDQAIKAAPNLVRAYQLRGRVKLRMGRAKEGIADCIAAQQLAAKDDRAQRTAHRTLGLAYFDTGNFKDAIKHLEVAGRQGHIYTHLYIYLARSRSGIPADRIRALKSLRAFTESLKEDDGWARALCDYLIGDLSEEELLARANKETKFVKLQQLCEAYGYIGQQARVEGNEKKATESFKLCIATNVGFYMEFSSADMALRRSGKR
jgi:lipoprotein NlpI